MTPSVSRWMAQTLLCGKPFSMVKLTNLSPSYRETPPPVPNHRIPLGSTQTAQTQLLGKPFSMVRVTNSLPSYRETLPPCVANQMTPSGPLSIAVIHPLANSSFSAKFRSSLPSYRAMPPRVPNHRTPSWSA